jgi:DNA-binding LacI/PurR family transcriptional regulator
MPPPGGWAYAHGVSDPVGAGSQGCGRPPTIYEVARQAGVSIATVSRVLSGASRVGDASRRRVEHAVAATGWVPDPAARQLAGAGGDVVILAIGVADRQEFAADPYYARVIAGAQEETACRGLSLAVQLGQRGSVAASGAWRRNRRCLGVVLVNVDAEEAACLSGLGASLVSMGRSGPSLPSVDPENEAGAKAAIQHLVSRGCRRIAMIAGPDRNPCARERLAGYRSVMRSAGLPEAVFSADFTRTGATEATRLLLRTTPGPDAVFAASDLMAAAALQVLIGSGRRVPDDVAVVGFDDSPPALMTTPALSTVRQPVEKLAALAVRTLLDPAGARPPDQRMPTRLVVRASSAA